MWVTTARTSGRNAHGHFIRPYVDRAHAHVFSRESFAPDWIDRAHLRAIPPSIDPFTPKNCDLTPSEVLALLGQAGLLRVPDSTPDRRVDLRAEVVRDEPALDAGVPLVVQVSRWDRMKDMIGVLHAFVEHVGGPARLVLAGPAVDGVSDDPEGLGVWRETVAARLALPKRTRSRVHLAALPMDDPAENALVVNALQRHASVVAQKSLAEGFGLTVAEAMWKQRPVVASAVGGIVDQVVDRETGRLVDPYDLAGFGSAVEDLLANRAEADRLGPECSRAHRRPLPRGPPSPPVRGPFFAAALIGVRRRRDQRLRDGDDVAPAVL